MTNEPTPDEVYSETLMARWEAMREQVESFYMENGTWPHEGNDPAERKLGQWLSRMRAQARRATLPQWQRDALDETSRRVAYDWLLPRHLPAPASTPAPKPTQPLDRPSAWSQRLTAVEAFRLDHGRWPRGGAKDPSESALGWWLLRQRERERSGSLSAADAAALDETGQRVNEDWRSPSAKPSHRARSVRAPGISDAQQHTWETRRASLEAFYRLLGRWPSRSAADEVERSLAAWLTTQRHAHHRGVLEQVRVEAMDQMSRRVGQAWTARRYRRRTMPTADAAAVPAGSAGDAPPSRTTAPDGARQAEVPQTGAPRRRGRLPRMGQASAASREWVQLRAP